MTHGLAIVLCLAGAAGAADVSLKVAEGFVAQRTAGPPGIQFPMFACLDDSGNLFVAESSGLDLYAELQKQTRRCRISKLSARDADGQFQRVEVFADQLVFPMGLAWRDGKLYVADPPDLVVLEDSDGDGRADQRRVILSGFGHRDNGSLHGLTFGPDGWLYMTMGSPDGYRLKREDGSFLAGSSGALLRCRADGGGIEVVSRGFENLIEVVFMPAGEIIGTDNWYSWPRDGLRDALVHLVEGGLYPMGLQDRGTKHLVSGDPLPPIAMYPAVALSGLMRHSGKNVPTDIAGALFSAQHNTRKIVRHRLERAGATFRSSEADFVWTEDPDFHPSDVLEDADGSVLVVDTGSWYVHHCPTGAILQSAAKGGIHRVRQASSSKKAGADPEWPTAAVAQTILRDRHEADPERLALAARVLGRRREKVMGAELAACLDHPAAHVRLAAAEALALAGDAATVPALVSALTGAADRFLEHALVHALHRLANRDQLIAMLSHAHPRVQEAAMVLLDQPPQDGVPAEVVAARVFAKDESLQRTAFSILERHGEWAPRGIEVVRRLSGQPSTSERERQALSALVVAFHGNREMQSLVAAIVEEGRHPDVRVAVIEALNNAKIETLPASWLDSLRAALRPGPARVQMAALQTLKARRAAGLEDDFTALTRADNITEDVRAEAVHALVRLRPRLQPPEFAFLLGRLKQSQPPMTRMAAAEALSGAELDSRQFKALLETISGDSVIAPATPLAIAQRVTLDAASRDALLDLLTRSVEAGWQLSHQQLAWLKAAGANAARLAALEALLDRSQNTRADVLTKHEELLKNGDALRGRAIFTGRGACSACHRVGAEGGPLGPDLTRIGAVRAGRDLVEAILFPSASFAQGYETWHAVLKNGEELAGVRVRQPDETPVLRAVSGTEYRLPASQVEKIEQMKFSLMPEGLLSALDPGEIRDLLAYLQSLR